MDGLVLHAKYCFMPNKLGGCGIQGKDSYLFDYAAEGFSDKGLAEILKTFEAAYPYIKFIAEANNIRDPFDARVVEAYWIGNQLLERVDKKKFYNWCFERYKKQADPKTIKLLVGKVPLGALPHHSFHVFNSYLRGSDYGQVLSFINECKITVGKVVEISEKDIEVEYSKVELGIRGLELRGGEKRKVKTHLKGKSFVKGLKKDDFVAFHWGWVCDVLTSQQAKRLENYSENQLMLFREGMV